MFFILSKVMWFLLAPLNLMTVLITVGIVCLRLGKQRTARLSCGLALVVLLVFGVLPLGPNALHYLESRYTKPAQMPVRIDGILVLGGAVETQASEISGRPEFNNGVDRVLAAMELARAYPKAKIVFSGGSGRLIDNKRVDSVDMKIFLKNMGFNNSHVVYEDLSRTTFENMINSESKVRPHREENWLLITSGYHMPRAMGVARKIGWGLIPYPVDYRGPGSYRLIPPSFDVLDNFYQSQLALREMTGMLSYRMAGKS